MKKKHHHKKKPGFFKKWSAKLHLWLGLSVGLIVFIVSLSGTLFVFKDEVQNSIRKEAIYVKPETVKSQSLPIDILRNKVTSQIKEKHPLSAVEIPLDKNKSYMFSYYEKSKKDGTILTR